MFRQKTSSSGRPGNQPRPLHRTPQRLPAFPARLAPFPDRLRPCPVRVAAQPERLWPFPTLLESFPPRIKPFPVLLQSFRERIKPFPAWLKSFPERLKSFPALLKPCPARIPANSSGIMAWNRFPPSPPSKEERAGVRRPIVAVRKDPSPQPSPRLGGERETKPPLFAQLVKGIIPNSTAFSKIH